LVRFAGWARKATEVFYHLRCGCGVGLLERSLKRGWRATVQAASEERVQALDTLLWTYDNESFLPHGTARDGRASAQPIYLTAVEDNPNAAHVRFLVDGATLADASPTSGSLTCSTAAIRTRSRERVRHGRTPKREETPSAIGSRMKTGAGSRRREISPSYPPTALWLSRATAISRSFQCIRGTFGNGQ
jgi:DNA polymerase IIIc chi subunit